MRVELDVDVADVGGSEEIAEALREVVPDGPTLGDLRAALASGGVGRSSPHAAAAAARAEARRMRVGGALVGVRVMMMRLPFAVTVRKHKGKIVFEGAVLGVVITGNAAIL